MALSILLLLSALLSSLLLLPPSHCVLGPTSATLAISQATGTICGITAGTHHRRIQCTKFGSATSFLVRPKLSFDSISGGHNFICGLSSGDSSFFCWDGSGTHSRIKCVYSGPTVLTELSVGARHVAAAIAGDGTKIRWWRYGCHHSRRLSCRHFPSSVPGKYHSLTSGDSFTCAINGTHNVSCWGPRGKLIQKRFEGVYMRSISAGGSRMCGLTITGNIICSAPHQPNVRSDEAFEFIELAIGSNHTCAIRRKDRTVVCWGRTGVYFPVASTRFEFLVAGGDLICGLTTDAFTVVCWDFSRMNVTLSFPNKILPGACVPDETFCSCGIYPDSGNLCGGSGVICKRSDTSTDSCQFPAIIALPEAPSLTTTWERIGKWWFVYAVFGTVFTIAGIGLLWYLLCLRFCLCGEEQEEIDESSQEEHEGQAAGYRHLERILPVPPSTLPQLTLQSSGTTSSVIGPIQIFRFADLKAATSKFSKHARLGSGSFGIVYRARLSDGREVAVKHCHSRARAWHVNVLGEALMSDLERAFESEVATLARARHANIVGLIGYCMERNERLCVFEYMANKDLYGHLHPKKRRQLTSSPVRSSWRLRVKILLDAAKGIEYLHRYADPRIIHRDIKSSNILLDENWAAKVSDFGLALFGPEPGCDHVGVDGPCGTVGYMDPECNGETKRVTPWSDVYSFGVVMLEMVSGRKAFEQRGNMTLANFAAPRIATGKLMEILDKRPGLPVGPEMQAIEMVAHLAEDCVMGAGILRPSMRQVVLELESALALFDQAESSGNRYIGENDLSL